MTSDGSKIGTRISPDGKRLMISAMQEIDSVMLADGAPGARFPDREGPL